MKVLYEKKERVATITINRPEVHNALDFETAEDLADAFTAFRDDDDLWIAVLTGAGDQTFCSGADLKSAIPNFPKDEQEAEELRRRGGGISQDFECWKPIIAAINGYCFAGGFELMLACDLRIASEQAVFGLREVCWGIIPAGGGTQRLPRSVPLARAMEIILTGNKFSAQEAYQMGLINQVVPHSQLMDEVEKWVQTLLKRGPLALRAAKKAVLQGLDIPLTEGLKLESRLFRELMHTQDAVEGPKAFAEKRRPIFRGK
jgi:E-phenylitaconyl-CoA hydratase